MMIKEQPSKVKSFDDFKHQIEFTLLQDKLKLHKSKAVLGALKQKIAQNKILKFKCHQVSVQNQKLKGEIMGNHQRNCRSCLSGGNENFTVQVKKGGNSIISQIFTVLIFSPNQNTQQINQKPEQKLKSTQREQDKQIQGINSILSQKNKNHQSTIGHQILELFSEQLRIIKYCLNCQHPQHLFKRQRQSSTQQDKNNNRKQSSGKYQFQIIQAFEKYKMYFELLKTLFQNQISQKKCLVEIIKSQNSKLPSQTLNQNGSSNVAARQSSNQKFKNANSSPERLEDNQLELGQGKRIKPSLKINSNLLSKSCQKYQQSYQIQPQLLKKAVKISEQIYQTKSQLKPKISMNSSIKQFTQLNSSSPAQNQQYFLNSPKYNQRFNRIRYTFSKVAFEEKQNTEEVSFIDFIRKQSKKSSYRKLQREVFGNCTQLNNDSVVSRRSKKQVSLVLHPQSKRLLQSKKQAMFYHQVQNNVITKNIKRDQLSVDDTYPQKQNICPSQYSVLSSQEHSVRGLNQFKQRIRNELCNFVHSESYKTLHFSKDGLRVPDDNLVNIKQ